MAGMTGPGLRRGGVSASAAFTFALVCEGALLALEVRHAVMSVLAVGEGRGSVSRSAAKHGRAGVPPSQSRCGGG